MTTYHGRKPAVGDRVYIDFGDSVTDHPEVTGIVSYISDAFITLELMTDHKRFPLENCRFIEVLED